MYFFIPGWNQEGGLFPHQWDFFFNLERKQLLELLEFLWITMNSRKREGIQQADCISSEDEGHEYQCNRKIIPQDTWSLQETGTILMETGGIVEKGEGIGKLQMV